VKAGFKLFQPPHDRVRQTVEGGSRRFCLHSCVFIHFRWPAVHDDRF